MEGYYLAGVEVTSGNVVLWALKGLSGLNTIYYMCVCPL